MNNQTNPMTWGAFKSALEENAELHLQFQYEEGKFVENSYHITEIKQAPIVSVDCGGQINNWTEVIVQLWEPQVKQTERSMTVGKALKIVNLVEKSLPLNPDAVVKIEFGNSRFDTRQMYPGDLTVQGESFNVQLVPDFTQCKALSRDQTCGTPSTKAPQLVVAGEESSSCTPGGGCC